MKATIDITAAMEFTPLIRTVIRNTLRWQNPADVRAYLERRDA